MYLFNMSFITKRDRIFHDYDLFDLPSRNEGKLKAYGSCTDARAWSHFGTDKSEHLADNIKRNNDLCRPKYIPTDVIVNTLMKSKNTEITRLKRKIAEFEQMLAAYDQLELTNDQKCDIYNAHEAIRAAYRELDDMYLDLDLTGFTEGVDSETFETGKSRGDMSEKSRGDEWSYRDKEGKDEKKSVHIEGSLNILRDFSTNVHDPRIEEMQDMIIVKDAKLSAMQNTIAVMENDICEPYSIYAHIYTALAKIYGILCQNSEYKRYLDLLSVDKKDSIRMDIKGKILYKMKVLEKFCLALIAPCTSSGDSKQVCLCYHTDINTRVETAYAFTSADVAHPINLDSKRTQLIADIMDNDEMKEIFCKIDDDKAKSQVEIGFILESYNIDSENLNRLKDLQISYNELVVCYETLKRERDILQMRCNNYIHLESELENIRLKLKDYNEVWSDKEHFRKRAEDLNPLKEKFLVLSEETLNLESQYKAECEINAMKALKIVELTNENINLEKKINAITIAFEKEKNYLECKLKETECKMMCQEEQIKSMSIQIDNLLEQDNVKQNNSDNISGKLFLLNEIESLKETINSLKNLVFCNEEEKQHLQKQFEEKLDLINTLRLEIEDWKSKYQNIIKQNDYLEKDIDVCRIKIDSLSQVNLSLTQGVDDKNSTVKHLEFAVKNKSEEINKLIEQYESINNENKELKEKNNHVYMDKEALEMQKQQILLSLQQARQESKELSEKVKEYEEIIAEKNKINLSLQKETKSMEEMRNIYLQTVEENKNIRTRLEDSELNNSLLTKELIVLKEGSEKEINHLQCQKNQYLSKLNLVNDQVITLENKLSDHYITSKALQELQESNKSLDLKKNDLEQELQKKSVELHKTVHYLTIAKKESEELLRNLEQNQSYQEHLNENYQIILNEKMNMENEIESKNRGLNDIKNSLQMLTVRNQELIKVNTNLEQEIKSMKYYYNEICSKQSILQRELDEKNNELNKFHSLFDKSIDETRELQQKLLLMENEQKTLQENIKVLEYEKQSSSKSIKDILKSRENSQIIEELRNKFPVEDASSYFHLLRLDKLNKEGDEQIDLQLAYIDRLEKDIKQLDSQNKELIAQNINLEEGLNNSRKELNVIKVVSDESIKNISKEFEELKKEKAKNQNKIRDLLNKLDEYDNTISNLSEDILARDDKITILENHVNELEDELRRLQQNFIALLETSEDIKNNTFQKMDESLKIVEAHHSRTTQDMKSELVKLQKTNTLLEEQLSVTKIKSQESIIDKNRYISQIMQLDNEKDIIVRQIIDLERNTIGGSPLSSENYNINDILAAIDRLRKYLNSKNTKTCTLEQKLLHVQTSSQLLQSKADEAKKIIEKEKFKIVLEKEDAIRDRIHMEKELADLKKKLEIQISIQKHTIKDLEAELLNKKLLIENMKSNTQEYISKLKNDLDMIKNLYQNVIKENEQLQKQLQQLTKENNEILDKTNYILEEKMLEIKNVQKQYIKEINKYDIGTETEHNVININFSNISSQTEEDENIFQIINDFQKNYHKPNIVNEIQVYRANTEPTLDFVRNKYFYNKMKQLSCSSLKQYSISSNTEVNESKEHKYDIGNEKLYGGLQQSILCSSSSKHNTGHIQPRNIMDSCNIRSNFIKYSNKLITALSSANQYSDTIVECQKCQDRGNDICLMYQDRQTALNKSKSNPILKGQEKDKKPIRSLQISRHSKKSKKLKTKHLTEENLETLYLVTANDRIAMLKQDSNDNEPITNSKIKLDILLPRVEFDTLSQTVSNIEKKSLSLDFYATPLNATKKNMIYNNKSLEPNLLSLAAVPNDMIKTVTSKHLNVPLQLTTIKQESLKAETSEVIYERNYSNINNYNTVLDNSPKIIYNIEISEGEDEKLNTFSDNVLSLNNVKQAYSKNENTYFDNMDVKREYCTYPIKKATSLKSSVKNLEKYVNKSILVKLENSSEEYENKIKSLTNLIENIEKEYKTKIEVIKTQYDNNIKTIINEHNQGVQSIQSLHEETLQDIIKIHENEIDNLRTLSVEAMKKVDQYDKENKKLQDKLLDLNKKFVQESNKFSGVTGKKKKLKHNVGMINLTKTNVEAINVQPKHQLGPCTCSVDGCLPDTIRNIFDQVDVSQRKAAENTYMKYIANKLLNNNMDSLDAQELSFLHLKVCRTWKIKTNKEDALQKKISSLEEEVINKQRHTQQHFANLDRMVEKEKKRLQIMREAVCRGTPVIVANETNSLELSNVESLDTPCIDPTPFITISERKSAGDLLLSMPPTNLPSRTHKLHSISNRAVLVKMDAEERKEKRMYHEDPPIKLRRAHDRTNSRGHKK